MTTREKEKLLHKIEFEYQWLRDVLTQDGHVNFSDIHIAFDGVASFLKNMEMEAEE